MEPDARDDATRRNLVCIKAARPRRRSSSAERGPLGDWIAEEDIDGALAELAQVKLSRRRVCRRGSTFRVGPNDQDRAGHRARSRLRELAQREHFCVLTAVAALNEAASECPIAGHGIVAGCDQD